MAAAVLLPTKVTQSRAWSGDVAIPFNLALRSARPRALTRRTPATEPSWRNRAIVALTVPGLLHETNSGYSQLHEAIDKGGVMERRWKVGRIRARDIATVETAVPRTAELAQDRTSSSKTSLT